MSDVAIILTAIGVFITVAVPAFIALKVARSAAKKADIESMEGHYAKLQNTYLIENERLHLELVALHNENKTLELAQLAARLDCQKQLDELRKQLTEVMSKLPEPGAVQPVVVVGVKVPLPVEIRAPLPLPMTAAEKAEIAKAVEESVAAH